MTTETPSEFLNRLYNESMSTIGSKETITSKLDNNEKEFINNTNVTNGAVSSGIFKADTAKEACNTKGMCTKKQKDRKVSEIRNKESSK